MRSGFEMARTKRKHKDETSDEPDAKQLKVDPFPQNDLVLVVENKELYVNSQILKNVSPVFRTMLESDFKEKKEKKIMLEGKKYEDVVKFLKCIYPFIQEKITTDNVFQLIPLADEYQLDLKKQCEEFLKDLLFSYASQYQRPKEEKLQHFDEPGYSKSGFSDAYNKDISIDLVVKSILAAEKYGMEGLLVETIKYASVRKFEILENQPEYTEISLETRNKIVSLRLRMIEEYFKTTRSYNLMSVPSFINRSYTC